MTCRTWRTLFSPLWWSSWDTDVTRLSQLHDLEEIISSPLSGTAKDHIHHLCLEPRWDHGDKDSYRFLSAWRSLSRCLHQVTNLKIGAVGRDSHPLQLQSRSIGLRPCPRPFRHIRDLRLTRVTFPTFSTLFRDIGALSSLERLELRCIQWNGACDPKSPPSSTATFSSIKYIYAENCTEHGWLLIWIFTASSLRYRHPWRAPGPDDVEKICTRSVRADVRAIAQAFRWVLSYGGASRSGVELEYVDCPPKGI